MKVRSFDWRHLDVAAFAAAGGELAGDVALPALERLAAAAAPEAPAAEADRMHWSLRGEQRKVGGSAQVWLHLEAQTQLQLACQRCLQPMRVPLQVQRSLRFVEGEEAAAEEDAESEEDVLALSRSMDAQALVEDELLLALPLVPRHERCPVPLVPRPDPAVPAEDAAPRAHPFAALAQLKRNDASS